MFQRNIDVSFVAELHATEKFELELNDTSTERGYDAKDRNGNRYQVKYRSAQNVDTNNFEFDYIVLVTLDDDYQLMGIWRATVGQAREIFAWRPKVRKYQATQKKFKKKAEPVT